MMLEVKAINKSFNGKQVLKNINFQAESGIALGLLGRNGAGKSTILRIIMNIFPADSGEILIDGKSNINSHVKIGYLPEERGLFPKKTVLEQMTYFGQLRDLSARSAKKRAEYLLDRLEATEYLNKKLDSLSKGNQQKIQLAIALINDPEVIILDEPFSGLDPVNAQILKSMVIDLVSHGKIVLFSSHQMQYVEEFCEQICMMNQGEIVLNGDLNKIKKSYKRNKVFILPEHKESLMNVIKENSNIDSRIVSLKEHGNGFIVNLKDEEDKSYLLQWLLHNQISIDHFSVIEPTLEEIFVEKAGGNYEI